MMILTFRASASRFSLYKTSYHFILDMSALIILSGPRFFSRSFRFGFRIPIFSSSRHVSCITTTYPYSLYNMGFLLIIW